ncbi:MAG TPA: efflux RND transporter periplasmic adaptor subunit [Gemmatimonadaceae bacterium]|nr:efflux RND transporter periplasmic adaptor subunit [Gemmatimonadaceae bacterium]
MHRNRLPAETTVRGLRGGALILTLVAVAACTKEPVEETLRVAVVAPRDIVVSASAAGAIEPITTVEVKSQASGEIIEVNVDEGDEVRRGQLLARVDARIPQNAVGQANADSVVAKAQLDNAEARLRRAEMLHSEQALTGEELEAARLDRATAYAASIRAERTLEDARTALEQTEVRAPSDGVILGRTVEVGSVIAAANRDVGGGAVLFRMATLDTVEVRALVDETDIGLIKPGQPVTITVAAYPNRPFRGDVLRIGAEGVLEQNVTVFPVVVRINNEERLLKPAMNAEVEIHIGQEHDVLAVPNVALRELREIGPAAEMLGLTEEDVAAQIAELEGVSTEGAMGDDTDRPRSDMAMRAARPNDPTAGGEFVVFTMRNDTVRVVPVRTGFTDFDYSMVLSGLVAGDSVVILPTAGLLADQERRQEWINRRVGGGPLGGN